MHSCKCGCLITKQSIVDYKCDGCYLKQKRKNENHDKVHFNYVDARNDKLAMMQKQRIGA